MAETNDNKLITAKDAFGKTVTKTAAWFGAQLQIFNEVPGLRNYEAALNMATDLIHDRQGDKNLNWNDVWTIGRTHNIPINAIKSSGGGGGGGKSAEQRKFDIQSLAVTVSNEAKRLGLQLNNDAVVYVATVAEKQGFSQEQLTTTLTGMTDWSALQEGDLTTNVSKFKELGRNYLVKIDDKTAQDWAVRIANKSLSENTVQSIIAQQAKTLNPWLTATIDSGISPMDVLSASRNRISDSLGIDASAIDFTDNQYLKMVTVEDPKAGTRLATNSELQKNIRTDSRWGNSKEAKDLGTSMASTLGKIFGRNAF
jgi:hypothetical protein